MNADVASSGPTGVDASPLLDRAHPIGESIALKTSPHVDAQQDVSRPNNGVAFDPNTMKPDSGSLGEAELTSPIDGVACVLSCDKVLDGAQSGEEWRVHS
ncbi:hypothetical protein SESBI_39475 [Sesbania bispinosa]|nr:hypothetical protein SESBI_39475 [Sesbania bispinosa]